MRRYLNSRTDRRAGEMEGKCDRESEKTPARKNRAGAKSMLPYTLLLQACIMGQVFGLVSFLFQVQHFLIVVFVENC